MPAEIYEMKTLERALDVHVGKREYIEGEARTPGRGQELRYWKEEGWYFPVFQFHLSLRGLVGPRLSFREL